MGEQLGHELRMGARQEDLRAALLAAHVIDIGADAVAVRKISRGISSSRRMMPSPAAEIDDDVAVFDALDGAVDDLADAVLEFLILASRSASRTFCTITCLADWAAMRPKSSGGSGSAMKSPRLGFRIAVAGIVQMEISVAGVLDSFDNLEADAASGSRRSWD
jgi:hypothetical protein